MGVALFFEVGASKLASVWFLVSLENQKEEGALTKPHPNWLGAGDLRLINFGAKCCRSNFWWGNVGRGTRGFQFLNKKKCFASHVGF